jgi:hypothetical protein
MRRRSSTSFALAALAACLGALAPGCGGDGSTAPTAPREGASDATVTVELAEERGSGQAGTATLEDGADGALTVVVELSESAKHSYHPAHVHSGTCAEYRKLGDFNARLATVVDDLQDVRDGRSESSVYGRRLADRTTGAYSINVHEPVHPYEVVACGDIPSG